MVAPVIVGAITVAAVAKGAAVGAAVGGVTIAPLGPGTKKKRKEVCVETKIINK
jgi:hypothetical protein